MATYNITTGTGTATITISTGARGPAGNAALPAGGTTGQVLVKESATDGDAGWLTVTGTGDALQALNLDQFADVVQPPGATLTISGVASIINANTGDETISTIKTKLGIATLSGSNTGDQDLSGYQVSLVSGTNIKTLNGTSLLGSGNITITGGGEITIQEEGSSLSTAATTLNFVGPGITASGTTATKTITINSPASNPTGITGADAITNIVSLTQAEYDAITPNATTYYVITDADPPGGTGTVTSVSVTTANGISGSVATATSTPAITLTLGAIAPTSVNGIILSGSSTPTLAITGTASISGANTGDQTTVSGNAGTVTTINGRLTEGAGTILTGSGTAASPYAVNAVVAASDIRATGLITYTGLPTSGQTLTIGIRAYTFQSTGPLAASDILIGTDVETMIANTVTAINSPATGTANSDVIAEAYSASEVRLIARVTGTGGNSVALSETASNTAVSGSTLTQGGTLGTAAFTASTAYSPVAGSSSIATVGTVTAGTISAGVVVPWEIQVAASDETTALTAAAGKVTFRMPWAATLSSVIATVTTAPTGSTLVVDINEGGTSVLSTKLSIDATEKTSTTAATAAVISDSALASDAEITIDIDQVGSTVAGAGLKVTLKGTRTI